MKNGFGDRILSEIEAQGYSRDLFAEAADVNIRNLNNWLVERSEPKFEMLQKFSELLQINLHWVLTGKGPIDRPSASLAGVASQEKVTQRIAVREENERAIAKGKIEQKIASVAKAVEIYNRDQPLSERVEIGDLK